MQPFGGKFGDMGTSKCPKPPETSSKAEQWLIACRLEAASMACAWAKGLGEISERAARNSCTSKVLVPAAKPQLCGGNCCQRRWCGTGSNGVFGRPRLVE